MNKTIPVAEMFFSVQGEGPNAGVPAVFLRLAHCNLSCGVEQENLPATDAPQEEYEERQSDDADWVCDTLAVWREPEGRYTPEELVEEWEGRGFLDALRNGAHIILTGGEPTLPMHQNTMPDFFDLIQEEVGKPHVEVETNGSIKPLHNFDHHIDQYNVSLKLSNSGMSEERRLDEEALEWYADGGENPLTMVKFKFVIADEGDVAEVKQIISEYDIPDQYISLMPAGSNQEQLRETYPKVAELCKKHGWLFSPRLQVDIWNEAVGV